MTATWITSRTELLLLLLWLCIGFCGGLLLFLYDLMRGHNVSMREGGFIILFVICPLLGPVVLYQIVIDIVSDARECFSKG